jgi:mannose-6-phosphate isomerase
MTMTDVPAPFRLAPTFAARIWGRTDLTPWYALSGLTEKVGEAWLTGPESLVETGAFTGKTLADIAPEVTGGAEFPLLVKMLFPDEKLSVQVHPDDDQARSLGLGRGKTECWYVLEAEPGARVACGLQPGVTVADVEQAVADASLESLLLWLPAAPGDMIFVDAGTVHAIGPGVTLLEVQQTSDITYRLYDYGRPRELHLDQGLAVVKTETAAGHVEPRQMPGFTRLIESEYFVVDRYHLAPGASASLTNPCAGCVVGLVGKGSVGGTEILPGQAVVLPRGASTLTSTEGLTVAFCWEPD